MNINQFNEDLFEKIRGQFSNVTIANDSGEVVMDPSEGMFFEFTFEHNGQAVGDVVISLADDDLFKVYFSNDLVEDSDSDTRDAWYNFLREMRKFSARNLLNFETRNISKARLDKKDFQFLMRKQKDDEVMEGKLYGSKQKSYQDLNGAKLIVQHRKTVDEEKMGSRSRNIKAIYIENSDGERFKFTNNYLPGARAMARHVSNGGYPNDAQGSHITEIMKEMQDLKHFVRKVKSNEYVDDDAREVIECATDRYYGLKNTLISMNKQKGYMDYFENWEPNEIEVDENDINDLRNKLTRSEFDDQLTDSLSAVGRAMKLKEKKQGGVFDYGKWLRMAKSAGAEVSGDVKSSTATKDGVEIGSWSQEESDLDAKYGSDVKDPGYGEINLDTSDRGEGGEREFEVPSSLNMMAGDNVIKTMKFVKGDRTGPMTAVLRDISARTRDDETSVFAADMAQRIASVGTTFGQEMDEEFKSQYMKAIDLVKMYIATTDKSESVKENTSIKTEDLLAQFERNMDNIEEGYTDSEEVADQIIASIGNKDNVKMADVVRAISEFVVSSEGDDPYKTNQEEIADIVMSRLGVTEAWNSQDPEESPVFQAIVRRILDQHTSVLMSAGPEAVLDAVQDIADSVGDVDEIGSSDVSIWTNEVLQQLQGGYGESTEEVKEAKADPKIVARFAKVSPSKRSYYIMQWAKEEGMDSDEAMELAGYVKGDYMGAGAYRWKYVGESDDAVEEGRMSDIHLEITDMIQDGESDEDIMAKFPGLVSARQLKDMRAEMDESVVESTADESLDWLKKAAGIGSNAKSNFGIREGEQGYQKSLRDEIGKYLEGLKK